MTDLVTTSPSSLPSTERRERMAQQARASKAERTWHAYGSDWQIWEAWAAANGAIAMPADPECVAEFLSDMTASRKLSTVRRYLASISVSHTLKGNTFERKHSSIKTILRGAARGAPLPRRVRPLLSKQVRALLRDLGDGPAERRNAALLSLGVASGCRRSELAGLDWARRGDGSGVIEITDDGGATITLFCSKTSQSEEPECIYLQPGIALKSLKHWLEAGAIAEGTPLFRAISKGGRLGAARLSDGSIARIVKARCAAAGLEPREFAGHSLRAGMVTSAAEHGIAEWRIRLTSRHKSDVLRQYIRPVEKRQHSLTNDIGL
jgi:integrase